MCIPVLSYSVAKENFTQVNTDHEQVNSGDKIPSPCGRLKSISHVWKSISSKEHYCGYKHPLKTDPERVVLNNQKSW